MVLKVLITVSLLQVAVKCDDMIFPEIKANEQVLTGIVSSDQKITYSFKSKDIHCQTLKQMKEAMDKLSFLAELNIRQKKVENSANSQRCPIVYLNLPKMEINSNMSSKILVESFRMMLKSYRKSDYFQHFDITYKSFAYSLVLQKFVFIDIDKLEFKVKSVDDQEKNIIFQKMATSFYNSLVKDSLSITALEVNIFKDLNAVISKEHSDLKTDINEHYKYIETKYTLEKILGMAIEPNLYNKKQNSKLSISVKEQNSKFEVRVDYNLESKTFGLENKEEVLMFFACKEQFINDVCVRISESQIRDFTLEDYVQEDNRFDADIQESSIMYLDNGVEKKKKVFEIYLIFIQKFRPGIISNEVLLVTEPSKFDFKDIEFFLCHNEYMNLAVYKKTETGFEEHKFILDSKPLKINKIEPLYQTTQFIFQEGFGMCRRPFSKVFYIKKSDKKIIFTLKDKLNFRGVFEKTKILERIYSKPLLGGSAFLILNKCSEKLENGSFQINADRRTLSYYSKSMKYPLDVVLKYKVDKNQQQINSKKPKEEIYIDSDCYVSSASSEFDYGFTKEKSKFNDFYWNFNLEDDEPEMESKRSVVYVSKVRRLVVPNYSFKTFRLPTMGVNSGFISFSKDSSSSPYKIRFVTYQKDNKIKEILFSDNTKNVFETLPDSFAYNTEDSNTSSNRKTNLIKDLDVVYLSDTEIVYQTSIPNYNKCDTVLVIDENNTRLRINCAFIGSAKVLKDLSPDTFKPSEGKSGENASQSKGLYRILTQAKPASTSPVQNQRILL